MLVQAQKGGRSVATTHSQSSAGREWLAACSGLLTPQKTQYPLYRKVSEPRRQTGRTRKISLSPGFDPRIVQHVTNGYKDYAARTAYMVKILPCTVSH